MRTIAPPKHTVDKVYELCVGSIRKKDLRTRLSNIKIEIINAGVNYKNNSKIKEWYKIKSFVGKVDSKVVKSVSRKELTDIYEKHMVGINKPARSIYNDLLLKAPNDICPFCGIGMVTTLDHYLPKAKYPLLTVLPINLVPSCKDCNDNKKSPRLNKAEEQCLHPYFDRKEFMNEQWLFACVVEDSPALIQYYSSPPDSWCKISIRRVQKHLRTFNLEKRYSVQAADELSSLREILKILYNHVGIDGVKQHLNDRRTAEYRFRKNSWKTAMYQALASSDWYCEEGWRYAQSNFQQ